MSQVLTLEKLEQGNCFQHPFLQELVNQIRSIDTFTQYRNWSDDRLIERLIVSPAQESLSSDNLNLDPFNQLLIQAFYNTVGAAIEKKTGYPTETFVQLKGKEFSSAVIFCGGVLVLYSLIWGYKSLGFVTIQELIESAESHISHAINKASQHLDFVDC